MQEAAELERETAARTEAFLARQVLSWRNHYARVLSCRNHRQLSTGALARALILQQGLRQSSVLRCQCTVLATCALIKVCAAAASRRSIET